MNTICRTGGVRINSCDFLLWTSSHECTSIGRPARTYLQQLFTDTRCSLEDLPEVMDGEKEFEKSVLAAQYDDDGDDFNIKKNEI